MKFYLNPKKAFEESKRQLAATRPATQPQHDENVLMEVTGQNGRLVVLPDRVRVVRSGLWSLAIQGIKGDKEILIKQIAAIKFKAAKHTLGYIGFDFLGGTESKTGLLDMQKDENAVMFHIKQNAAFEEARALIGRLMDEAHAATTQATIQSAPQSSPLDELQKLATLRDQGIVTEQEFQEQKAKLLGTQTANQSQQRFDPQTDRPL